MLGPRVVFFLFFFGFFFFNIKYHFVIIDSHTQRKRYGQMAQIYFGYKKTTTIICIRCVYPEELASFGLVFW